MPDIGATFCSAVGTTRGQPHSSYTSLTSWTSFSSLTLEHTCAHQAVHRNLLWGFSSVMEDNDRIQDVGNSSCIMWRTQGSVLYQGSPFWTPRPRHGVHYQDTSTGAASVVPLVRVVDSCTVPGVCPPIRQHSNAFLPRSACTKSPSPLDDMAMRGHERRPGYTDLLRPERWALDSHTDPRICRVDPSELHPQALIRPVSSSGAESHGSPNESKPTVSALGVARSGWMGSV